MAASICSNCLSRLCLSGNPAARLPTLVLPIAASFSTTPIPQNVIAKKKNVVTGKYREARAVRIKKKARERPKPPAPGERKAQKKRIVLSNANALEVAGLENLSPENMADAAKHGQMLALDGKLLDQLRECKAFKTTQNWNMFRQPSTLVRQESHELGHDIKEVTTSQQDQGFGAITIQKVVTGEKGSGKSIHLVQAQSMALLSGWVVVTIPECQDFVINTSSYAPVPTEDSSSSPSQQHDQSPQQLYTQPQLTSQLLSRIATANAKVLQSLKLVHTHPKSLPFKPTQTSTLLSLAEAGANDPQIAVPIFDAFWKELTEPGRASSPSEKGVTRPPVLVTLDGLDHWMGPSLYRNPDYKVIHAHQFTLIRHFLSLLFPKNQANSLANGGMILAATTGSNTPDFPTFQVLLQQVSALQAGRKMTDKDFPMPTPYSKVDQTVLDLAHNSQATGVQHLKALSKVESKGLLEYFARSGILAERITEHFLSERLGLSGGGVIGELTKLSKRVRV